jgi:hypothetical protein
LEAIAKAEGRRIEIGAVLLERIRGELPEPAAAGARGRLRWLERVDIVCPRQAGVARHAARDVAVTSGEA